MREAGRGSRIDDAWRVFSGKRKSAFPEKTERRGDRFKGGDPELVHVPLVTAVLFHVRHICRGFLRSFMAPGLDDFMKGVVHILRHAGGVPADVEAGAGFQPFPELFAFLDHEVLHIHLLFLVSGPGHGQLQFAGAGQLVQLVFITEVGSPVRIAEEQPVAALGAGSDAFLPECPERGDAGAGAHHDDGGVPVFRKAEILVGMYEYPGRMARLEAVRHIGGANAAALAVTGRIAHRAHAQVNLFGMGVRAGGDGIKARHDLFQDADKSLRGFEGSGVFRGQIQHVPAPQEIAEGFLIPGQKRVQLLAAGGGGPLGQQGFVDIGNVIAVNQGVFQACGFPFGRGNLGIRAEAELVNQGVRQGGVIGGNDGQGVPGNIIHPGTVQAVFNVDGFLGAAFPGDMPDGEDGSGKRIFFAVWFSGHDDGGGVKKNITSG